MDITPILGEDRLLISHYGADKFKINGQEYDHSVLLSTQSVVPWETPKTSDALNLDAIIRFANEQKKAEPIEILLIGTGETMQFIPASLRQKLRDECGAGVEIMDTGAACRTFNVLVAEDRRVSAALLVV